MIEKAVASAADAVVIDLEDAVPENEKAIGRAELQQFARSCGQALSRVFVRINSVEARCFEDDVSVVAAFPFAGVVVPKVQGSGGLLRVRNSFASECRAAGREPPGMIALHETPLGIINAASVARHPVTGLVALAFGAEDFSAGLGITASDAEPVINFARAMLVTAAAAAGVPAIDAPDFEIRDLDRLRRHAKSARQFGFYSKFAIHPCQLPTLHEVFAPTVAEREWAEKVVQAYEETSAAGRGAANLDGRMIDSATVRVAQAILARSAK